jgi:hypothetical protein
MPWPSHKDTGGEITCLLGRYPILKQVKLLALSTNLGKQIVINVENQW